MRGGVVPGPDSKTPARWGSVDDLPSQRPALTLVGGRPVHDLKAWWA